MLSNYSKEVKFRIRLFFNKCILGVLGFRKEIHALQLFKEMFCVLSQSFENLSVESGGSGPEKDDPPGKMVPCNTQLLYSSAAQGRPRDRLVLENV